MNIRFFLFISLLVLSSNSFAQLTYPYFQTFENRFFINNKNINLDVNGPEPLPRDEINVTYGYGYSWEVVQAPQKTNNALKLTAHGNDHNKKAYYPRSRSQVTFLLDNREPLFISYQIYIPNNDELIENYEKDVYHIIQQFQVTLWNPNTQTPYNLDTFNKNGDNVKIYDALGILTLNYSKSEKNIRELEFWSNSLENIKKHIFGEIDNEEFIKRRNRMKIKNGIEKGKWNEIIMKINFSEKFEEGYYQFWVNRNPVVLDSIGNQSYNEHYTSPHLNSKEEPFKFHTGFILYSTDKNPQRVPSLLKLGHYRQNTEYSQSIYYDNLRLWNRFPVDFTDTLGQTQIVKEQCDRKMTENDLILYAYDDPEADGYFFRFKNIKNGKFKIFKSDGPAVDLRKKRLLKGRKTYEVDVRTTGEFGEKCIVKSQKVK
jgi:hypothetical protein